MRSQAMSRPWRLALMACEWGTGEEGDGLLGGGVLLLGLRWAGTDWDRELG